MSTIAVADAAGSSERVDVLVVGSGAAGLVAALAAASRGCRVRVFEKTPWIGGTTALSEGMIWVPASGTSTGADSPAAALAYLRAAAAGNLDESRAASYVRNAAAMLSFIEATSPLRYEPARSSPDYYASLPGATVGVRAFRPRPFDVRARGVAWLDQIRPPLPTTMAFGGMMLSSDDYMQVLALRRSPRAWAHLGSLSLRYFVDRAVGFRRGARLTNGNAVVAGLLAGLERWNVRPETRTTLVRLNVEDRRVVGADLEGPSGAFTVLCDAVVLATGGFPGNDAWRRRYYPHVAAAIEHHSLAPPTNTGEGLEAALRVGARLDGNVVNAAAWTPVSRVPQRDGSLVPFPHYVDRAKPGVIAVDSAGQRFCNEASPYIRFVPALVRAAELRGESHVWLVADHRALRRYGLGAAPPAPGRIQPFVANGYLVRASSIAELELRLGIPVGALARTVASFNEHAERGVDPEFQRGVAAFDRAYGDAAHAPNPCLGPLVQPPFYAVRLYAGDIGTFVGLAVDADARVLGIDGTPIAGLYAAGNDVASPTGGEYPAAGVTIGAAMTFGFLAGCHAVTRSKGKV